ncbi:hypothetical protein [Bordetella petrii]|uniref:hypothetical protein n=1 Tax=Bordetella petrii TaxID=94624 RepID=UPI0012DC87FC|nr:hypothetical protein [Bordetella petrii]
MRWFLAEAILIVTGNRRTLSRLVRGLQRFLTKSKHRPANRHKMHCPPGRRNTGLLLVAKPQDSARRGAQNKVQNYYAKAFSMSSIIVARFDSVPSAKSAAHALLAEGFREEAVSLFRGGRRTGRVQPWDEDPAAQAEDVRYGVAWRAAALAAAGALLGTLAALFLSRGDLAVVGGAVLGACAGAAVGALWAGRRLTELRNAALNSIPAAEQAVLLTVQVEPDEEEAVMALLRDAGGFQVDREHGRWRGGRWTDREPLRRAPSSRRTTVSHRTQWQP